jgi:3-methyladenine DNA glycosylase/8-oxoguanine DNA glycosylase
MPRKIAEVPPFTIDLPRDYAPRFALRYMTRDPESVTEGGDGSGFVKAMLFDGRPAIVRVEFATGSARVRVEGSYPRHEAERAVLRLLGLPFDPRPFERKHAALVKGRRGLRVPLTGTIFEAIVWAICGQQVNLTFAYKLRRAVIELAGEKVGDMRAHPDAAAIARLDEADLTRRQFSRRKAEYLIGIARTFDAESLATMDAGEAQQTLEALRGFGVWSANYVMMRGCGFADCVPAGDTGLSSSLQDFFGLDDRPDQAMTHKLMEQYAPMRSLATFHFWMRRADANL